MTLGEKLRKLRLSAQLSTRSIEDVLKMGYGNLSRYERDLVQPTFKSVVKISRFYNIDIRDLAKCTLGE